MAKVIAVEWDDTEIRLACGSRAGSGISIDAVQCVPLQSTTDDPFQSIGVAVRAFAESCNAARCDVYAAAPRGSMELRSIQLPPSDDNELPDMVRFASQRSFAQIGDSWPMDFVRLPLTEQEGLTVLAAAVNPMVISKLKSACEPHNLQGLFVRSLATARLAISAQSNLQQQCVLCVNVVGQEVDLVVTENGQVTMIRTARLPESSETAVAQALLGEIKRTRFAAESQRSTARPTHIVIWGDCGGGKDIVSVLEEGTKIQVSQIRLVDAVQASNLKTDSKSLEQFVPVAGMLHQASHKDQFSMDFVHPRKRQEKKKPVLQLAIAAVVVVAAIGGGIWWYISEHKALDKQIASLQESSKTMDGNVKLASKLIAHWEKIDKFEKSNVQWLDQLVFLSEKSLGPDKVMFDSLTFSADARTGRGRMSSNVLATSADALTDLDASLRDDAHSVQIKKSIESKDKNLAFRWIGDPVIEINYDKLTAPVKKPVEAKPAEATSGTAEKEATSPDAESEQTATETETAPATSEKSAVVPTNAGGEAAVDSGEVTEKPSATPEPEGATPSEPPATEQPTPTPTIPGQPSTADKPADSDKPATEEKPADENKPADPVTPPPASPPSDGGGSGE
jgi:hypothetical protein